MIFLHKIPARKAVAMLKELQKGTIVQAYGDEWRTGTLHSVKRYGGSDVAYVQHDDNALPTMYYYSNIKIPRRFNLFWE